jgi:hypothetical protein
MTVLTTVAVLTLMNAGAPMSADAVAQYQKATQDIQGRSFGSAIETLNALALQYPKVAEIFATRGSALVSNAQYAAAEADCTYALTLKPNLPEATYALALAQEYLGKRAAAIESYRKYASFDVAPLRGQALARATTLASTAVAPAPVAAAGVGTATLVVYRNHVFAGGVGGLELVLDNRVLGDISMNQYVEIEVGPGAHILEARSKLFDLFHLARTWTHPVTIGNTPVYVNLDRDVANVVMQEVPASQATTEIGNDCQKAWSVRVDSLPPATAQAPSVVPAAP